MRKIFKSLKVIPEIHKLVKDLAEYEGRTVSKMLNILVQNFEQSRAQNELPKIVED